MKILFINRKLWKRIQKYYPNWFNKIMYPCSCGDSKKCTLALTKEEEREFKTDFNICEKLSLERFELRKEIARKGYEHMFNAASKEIRSFCKDYPMWRFYTNKDGDAAFRIHGLIRSSEGLRFKVISAAPVAYGEFQISDPRELHPVDMWNENQLKLISLDLNAYLFLDPCGYAMVGTRSKNMTSEEEKILNDLRGHK